MKILSSFPTILVFFLAVFLLFPGCQGSDGDDDDSAPAGDDDDEETGPVDKNDRDNNPLALVITTEEMSEAWGEFAAWKDRTGLRTEVVLIEDVLGKGENDFFTLQDYLRQARDQGVRYVLLGGDADQVPYLRSYTEVWAMEDYYGNAPVQTAAEILDADWDGDGDGVFGELDEDLTLEDLRAPAISVGRVPVETAEEARGYIAKLIRYELGTGAIRTRAACPLFMADVAASVPFFEGLEIDGGMTHEQLIQDYIPLNFQTDMLKLYGTEYYAELCGGQVATSSSVTSAMENEGYAFVVTNTHGGFSWLTMSMGRSNVVALENEVAPLFISTSCLTGDFADIADGNGDNPLQGGADSAGEELIKNPDGGAVAYLGNTLVGLGPVGGVQFNHSIARAIFKEGNTILGDAVKRARESLWTEVATVTVGELSIDFTMDMALFPGTEWYTLRSVILLGDPTLRVWTENPSSLEIEGPASLTPGYHVIEATVTDGTAPMPGTKATLDINGVWLIEKITDQYGKATFQVTIKAGDEVILTSYAANRIVAVSEIAVK
jgi:peptidase C25-like protein